MSENVLVTGGCGFIGSCLTKQLIEEGFQVRILDNLLRGSKSNVAGILGDDDVELIRGDVRDREVVDEAVSGVDYVVHLAATNLNRSLSYPQESLTVNVLGTNNVFRAAAEKDVKKILFASSASVYGDSNPPMSERDNPHPKTPYGIGKLTGEYLLKFYADQYDQDYIAYRFFNVYGAGQDTDAYYTSVINVFIKRIARGEPPVIHGSGEQSMDFVNVQDIARALKLGIDSDVTNAIFNVGSGESTSISELAEELINIMDVDIEPRYEPRDVLVSHRRADTKKAEGELDFEAEVSLQEGLTEVVNYVLDDMEDKASKVGDISA